MTAMEAALAAPEISRGGRGGAWFVTGPAGSGKSWLLGQVAENTDDRPLHWLRGIAGRNADTASFSALLHPPLDGGPTTIGVGDQLRGAALLVDDVHELPNEVLEALRSIARQAQALDILLVATQRSGTTCRATAAVATGCVPIALEPLDPLRSTFRSLVATSREVEAEELHLVTGGWYELVAVHPSIASRQSATELVRPRLAVLSEDAGSLATAMAFGGSLDDGSAETLARIPVSQLDTLVSELHAVGLMHGERMAPLVAEAIRQATPAGTRREVIDSVLAAGSLAARTELADWILLSDERSPGALALLVASGEDRPGAEAIPLLECAVTGGAPGPAKELLVQAHLSVGDSKRALAHALGAGLGGAPLRVALARAGRMSDAHEVDAPQDLQGATVAASVGDVKTATKLKTATKPGAVGAKSAAAALVAATLELVEGGDAGVTARDAARLARDGVKTSGWVLDPVTCAAIATALALDGEERASEGSAVAFQKLASVVDSWISMRAGRLADARIDGAQELHGVEAALMTVVDAAVALRADQLDVLADRVQRAVRALEGIQLDAWHLPLIVELLAPAARAGVQVPRLNQACRGLTQQCGTGSLLRLSHGIAELLAAVSADDATAVAAAAAAFDELEGSTPAHVVFGEVVPVIAAVFADDVRLDDVLQAAATLRGVGLVFEASRLTGAAAMRSTNESEAKTLLRESRAMRQERRSSTRSGAGDVTELSEREVEVARLVVQGRTHKEVGATLFISAKTVEHHVARIRNKLGAKGRAEMMSSIRDYLDATVDIDA